MQSQLVFKFRHRAPASADYILALEAALTAVLGDTAKVDGHDVRSDDINVFVITADPAATFRRSKPVLEKMELLEKVVVAHRYVGGASFKVIWPLKWGRKFKLE
jgi:hypothetical protein